MKRRTKIVATLGPRSDDPKILDRMIEAGMDMARLNFSHDPHDIHGQRAKNLRNRARAHGRQIGVVVDLQGPKIRLERFADGPIELVDGDHFILDANHDPKAGNKERVGIAYKELVNDVQRGDTLLINDGRVVLWVEEVEGSEVRCRVSVGGILSDRKGINKQGGGLSAPALTEKDKKDIIAAAEIKADYLAISFVRTAEDVNEARRLFREAGGKGGIIAKVERAEALDVLDEIILASDAIMVARGDLGVEIGDEALPPVQKDMISKARSMNRAVITATQMMESMIESPIPTRAEVFDVANAVLDGTDAVMLSAETAVGKYPDKVIAAMDRICLGVEKTRAVTRSDHRIDTTFAEIDEAIAMSTMYTANHLKVKAIAALTESGSTTMWMSRISSGIPIYAMTRHVATRRKVTLYRGVYPVSFDLTTQDHAQVNIDAIDELKRRGAVHDGDMVIITKGDLMGTHGGTNAMKIVEVGKLPDPESEQ